MTTFLTMDAMKTRRLQQKLLNGSGDGDNQSSVGENVLLGVTIALVAGMVTNPADVIKTRMMTQSASSQIPYASA
jgi:solute carrier family 25 (mitochondrial S-adenosylmethionine transporter), member 26